MAIDQRVFLSASEVATLAEAITLHYRPLVYTAAYAGLRAGELGALRRRDVDRPYCNIALRTYQLSLLPTPAPDP